VVIENVFYKGNMSHTLCIMWKASRLCWSP